MRTKWLNYWEVLRPGFWLIPTLMVLVAIGLSFVTTALDRNTELIASLHLNLLNKIEPEGARAVLATIAGSMINVTTVAFSITIVVLTLASSQFGPRLLRNFMIDPGNQIVLGTFISTYIYCLLILRTINTSDAEAFFPHLSIIFSVFLALANAGVLIYFIHHVAISIQADHVIDAVCVDLEQHMEKIFSEETPKESVETAAMRSQYDAEDFSHAYKIKASKSGYLQAIDRFGLLKICQEHDLLIKLKNLPGDFIMEGATIVLAKHQNLVTNPKNEGYTTLDKNINKYFYIGLQRTPEQDPEFAIRQLVEIAVRALSPGINDPYTAITCIDRLGATLCRLTRRGFPPKFFYGDNNQLRIIAKPASFTGVVNEAFDQIRQYGRSSAAVTIRLLETLTTVAEQTRTDEQRRALLRQAQMIERGSIAGLPEENDRQDVQQRYRDFIEATRVNEE